MAHVKSAARIRHKAECKQYKDLGIAKKNKERKSANRAKHLAKAKARKERRDELKRLSTENTGCVETPALESTMKGAVKNSKKDLNKSLTSGIIARSEV